MEIHQEASSASSRSACEVSVTYRPSTEAEVGDQKDLPAGISANVARSRSADATTQTTPSSTTVGGMSRLHRAFPATLAALSIVLFLVFCGLVRFDKEAQKDQHVQQFYMWYIHVAVMVFVGFGFLMTFLRRYSYSAVALNFVASCFVMFEAMIMVGFAQQQLWGHARAEGKGITIRLNLPLVIDAAFCAASAMITFGAVLGKTSPVQLLWLLALEVPVYAANQQLILTTMGVLDVGGSITIHVFGAYYGLAASMVLSKTGMGASHAANKPSYITDITSMIGTLFLWIYWPSFNGALASDPSLPSSPQQFNCVVNTLLSLMGACIATFAVSSVVNGKFDMMHIQNATLAGGVAIGSGASLAVAPGFSLGVGLIAGALSTLGFTHIGPWLEASIGLRDTCGVHNLHGMPGLLAAVVAAVASAWAYPHYGYLLIQGRNQPGYEIAGAVVTLLVAVTSGALVGLFIDKVAKQGLDVDTAFEDEPFWQGVVRAQLVQESLPRRNHPHDNPLYSVQHDMDV